MAVVLWIENQAKEPSASPCASYGILFLIDFIEKYFLSNKPHLFKVHSLMALSIFTLLCNHHYHPDLFSSCKTDTLYSFNSNYSLLHPAPVPGNHRSTFCFYQFDYLRSFISGIILYLSFCDWIISLSPMSSMFIHIVVCDGISFLVKAE